ncbi:uncharacterized protein [Diadema setosum]|uniref:uncharacterized protein n=1 Tax=Diadema setosum TaxID=31175 RepID=UPI003B3AD4CA
MYEITVGGVMLSRSSSSQTRLSPLPHWCVDVLCKGSNGFRSTTTTSIYCPKHAPAADALSIRLEEQQDANHPEGNLLVTCQLKPRDQSYPPIHTFIIKVDQDIVSSSDIPSFIIAPRPDKCTHVTCLGQNGVGSTSLEKTYCPTDADSLIEIQVSEFLDDDNDVMFEVSCHVPREYQPHGGFHSYAITVNNVTWSTHGSTPITIKPVPNSCTTITCEVMNAYGLIAASKTLCPTDNSCPEMQTVEGVLHHESTTAALLTITFILSVAVCVAAAIRRKQLSSPMGCPQPMALCRLNSKSRNL